MCSRAREQEAVAGFRGKNDVLSFRSVEFHIERHLSGEV